MSSPTILQILREEAFRNGYTVEELLAQNKRLHITAVRQYAMWRAHKETGRSLGAIGLVFNRDHTTVLHAIERVERLPHEARGKLGPRPPKKPARRTFQPARTFHGKPCIHGHGTLRNWSTGKCVVCSKEQDNRRYEAKRKAK